MTTYVRSTAPSTTAATAVPAHTLRILRSYVAGERYPDGRTFIRTLFAKVSRTYAGGGRLTEAEAARVVAAGRALWHEAQVSPLGGRVFG